MPIKLLFGAVAAPILLVANYLIPKGLVNAVGNLVTAERVDKVYELLFRFRPIREDIDHLLVGGTINEEAYARKTWPEDKFEVLYIPDIPKDIWRGVIWDGRLPGGRHVPWLAWRHCSANKIAALWRGAVKVGFRAGIVFALVTMTLSVLCQAGHLAAFAYPAWTTSWPIIAKWWLSVGIHSIFASLGSAVVAALAGACFSIAVTYASMNRRLESWWADQSYALTLHTRDATVGYGASNAIRPNVLRDYTAQVKEAVGRLKNQPVIPIGRSTGFVRRMGLWDAPFAGELVCQDGESARQHTIYLGASGTGKTRDGISPHLHRCLQAEWDGTFGAMILDGKGGTLARREYARIKEGMASGEFPRRPLFRIGVGDNMQAMDVCCSMTALKFRMAFERACAQAGGGSGDSAKWTGFAGGCLEKAKEIGNVLMLDQDWDCDPLWERYTPASPLGCYAIATNKDITKKCIEKINLLRASDNLPEALQQQLVSSNVKSAIEYFEGYWFTLNADTKSSITANINAVFDKISGAGELRDRFFSESLR